MYQMFSIRDQFEISAPGHLEVEGFIDPDHPRIPKRSPYVFRREALRDVLAFLEHPQKDGLYATGPTGSGKSSLITQVAARLNWPLHAVSCHGRMELTDLIGQFVLNEGSMQFVHGPLTQALREGHILLLNELDLMDPSELSGLNDCLEGQALVIAQNGGELIQPHPKFRLIATGNSLGSGDRTGLYQGVLRQNMAFLDRFRMIEVFYPTPEQELIVLRQQVPELPNAIAEGMIRVANEIRKLFMGSHESPALLSVTLSTRALIRWATLSLSFKSAPNPLEYALDRALTLKAEPEQRMAIHRVAADVFGMEWVKPNFMP